MPTEPLQWDTPGLHFDDARLVWDGELPRKPRPRGRAAAGPNPPPPVPSPVLPIMNTFRYHPAPKSPSGFTTRPVLASEIDVAALDTAIATAEGVPVEKCVAILTAYMRAFLAAAATGHFSTDVHSIVRFRPTCGGAQLEPDDFHNPTDLNADVALSFTTPAIRAWQQTLTLESMGLVGKLTPTVDITMNADTGQENYYVPGGPLKIMGDYLKFDRADTAQGIFFTPVSGPEVRATSYPVINPESVIVNVPTALSGPLKLRAAAFLNGSLRSFTYSVPITTAP